MKRGEIWVAQLEPKKGSEVGKQRPVLVFQTDLLNDVQHPTVIVLPITPQDQTENVLRYSVECTELHSGRGYVLIDQLRAIDSKSRMKKKIGKLAEDEMSKISRLVKLVLDL